MEELQCRAQSAGGFRALVQVLELQDAHVGGALACVYRGLLLQASSVMATAFELGPSKLDSNTWGSLLDFLRLLLEGGAGGGGAGAVLRVGPSHRGGRGRGEARAGSQGVQGQGWG